MQTRALIATLLTLALGCGGGGTGDQDAGAADVGSDAGPRVLSFVRGTDYPTALAYATAVILPVGTQRYLYVMGGSMATRTGLGTILATCTRAEILADGSLGAWEDARDITSGGTRLPLAGHGALRLNGESGEVGVGLAGGGGPAGPLPFVLGGVVQLDGTLGAWGRYDPMLAEGQSFGAFVAFEAHQLALVGGLGGAAGLTPLDRVVIAAIMNGAMSPVWRDGPSLPEARFGHATFRVDDAIYLVGGENDAGGLHDVIQTTRDATTLEVNGWATVGTLTATTSFPAAFVHEGQAWVVGGLDGGRATGAASARVQHADIGTDGHLGSFTRVAGHDLPLPLGASAYAYDEVTAHVYLVGGLTGPDLVATNAVVIGTLP
jgi:hypothetical protein